MIDDKLPQDQNPYEMPQAEVGNIQVSGVERNLVLLILAWVFLIPILVANGIFWGYFAFETWFLPPVRGPDGKYLLLIVFLVNPFVGMLYGLAIGIMLRKRMDQKHILLHPLLQALFQPFWFFVVTTAGCIVSIPIMLLFE